MSDIETIEAGNEAHAAIKKMSASWLARFRALEVDRDIWKKSAESWKRACEEANRTLKEKLAGVTTQYDKMVDFAEEWKNEAYSRREERDVALEDGRALREKIGAMADVAKQLENQRNDAIEQCRLLRLGRAPVTQAELEAAHPEVGEQRHAIATLDKLVRAAIGDYEELRIRVRALEEEK